MRNVLSTLLLLLLSTAALAQSPFAPVGAKWWYGITYRDLGPPNAPLSADLGVFTCVGHDSTDSRIRYIELKAYNVYRGGEAKLTKLGIRTYLVTNDSVFAIDENNIPRYIFSTTYRMGDTVSFLNNNSCTLNRYYRVNSTQQQAISDVPITVFNLRSIDIDTSELSAYSVEYLQILHNIGPTHSFSWQFTNCIMVQKTDSAIIDGYTENFRCYEDSRIGRINMASIRRSSYGLSYFNDCDQLLALTDDIKPLPSLQTRVLQQELLVEEQLGRTQQLVVCDMLGRQHYTGSLAAHGSLRLSLPAGLYVLQARNADGTSTQKVWVE